MKNLNLTFQDLKPGDKFKVEYPVGTVIELEVESKSDDNIVTSTGLVLSEDSLSEYIC